MVSVSPIHFHNQFAFTSPQKSQSSQGFKTQSQHLEVKEEISQILLHTGEHPLAHYHIFEISLGSHSSQI